MSNTLDVGMLIHNKSDWLGHSMVEHADQALSAHEGGSYDKAAIEVGICLEELLDKVMDEWAIKPIGSQRTQKSSIDVIRDSGKAPEALIKRLNGARIIRNMASHKGGHFLDNITEGDSLQLINILGLVVQWYCMEFHSKGDVDSGPQMLPIFLSVGTPHRLKQEQFIQHLRAVMRGLGVELRRLMPSSYSPDKPFDDIREIMSSCQAALVVGLDRSHAYAVFEKEKSADEILYQDQFLSTTWNQIEGSIASSLGLPILVLKESRLHNEGIFEASNHGHTIYPFVLDDQSKCISSDFNDYLEGWVQDIRQRA